MIAFDARVPALLVLLAVCGLCAPVYGDEVHLKNGSVLDATRIEKGEKTWRVTTSLGVVEVRAEDVLKVVERKKPAPTDPPSQGNGVDAPKDPVPAQQRPPRRRCTPPPVVEWPMGLEPIPAEGHTSKPVDSVALQKASVREVLDQIARIRKEAPADGAATLLVLLDHNSQSVRAEAMRALGCYNGPEILLAFFRGMDGADFAVADAAVDGAAEWFTRYNLAGATSLKETVVGMEPWPGGVILYTVSQRHQEPALQAAMELLDGTVHGVLRGCAVWTLRYAMDPRLGPRLGELLESPDAPVRKQAALACSLYKRKECIPRLIQLLSDGDADVAAAAHQALKNTTGFPLPNDPAAWESVTKGR